MSISHPSEQDRVKNAMSHAHFMAWAGQRAVLEEPIVLQENVPAFPQEMLRGSLPAYEWLAASLSPDRMGWPVRNRQIMMFEA